MKGLKGVEAVVGCCVEMWDVVVVGGVVVVGSEVDGGQQAEGSIDQVE